MNGSRRKRATQPKLINEIQAARSRVADAERKWKHAEEQWREAKQRRKEAKQTARFAKKLTRQARKEHTEAKETLARMEESFAEAVEGMVRRQKLVRLSPAKQKVPRRQEKPSATRPANRTAGAKVQERNPISRTGKQKEDSPQRRRKPAQPAFSKDQELIAPHPETTNPVGAVDAGSPVPAIIPFDQPSPSPNS